MPLTKLNHSSMPQDSVLQVLQNELTSSVTQDTTEATIISQAITPKSASSKILITCSGTVTAHAGNLLAFFLKRDNTAIGDGTGGSDYNIGGGVTNGHSSSAFDMKGFSIQYLDSPSSTSQITYKLNADAFNGTSRIGGRQDGTSIAVPTRITLMEIAG
jgi:hypothetical protein